MQKPLTKRRLKSLPRVKNRLHRSWGILQCVSYFMRIRGVYELEIMQRRASSTGTCNSFHIFGLLDIQQIFYGSDGVREPYLFEIM